MRSARAYYGWWRGRLRCGRGGLVEWMWRNVGMCEEESDDVRSVQCALEIAQKEPR